MASRRQDPDAADSGLQGFQFTFEPATTPAGVVRGPSTAPVESSASLSESVQTFPEAFGRTYHAYRAGSYAFPNDRVEQERLALQGETMQMALDGRLFMAPLCRSAPPRRILDVATGIGDWAIQMGDLFPSAEVVATDLSPIQPQEVPPNVNFYVEDSSDPWEYSQKFDYIHTRATAGCWASFENEIAQQAFASLEPGGWFESHELDSIIACDDGTLDPDGPLAEWFRDLKVAGDKCDRSFIVGALLRDVYERVGFVDVHEHIVKMPTNAWPNDHHLKDLGRLWERNLLLGLSGFSVSLFNRVYNRSPAQIEVSLVHVRQAISNSKIHAYTPMWVVWGRKPYPGEGQIPALSIC